MSGNGHISIEETRTALLNGYIRKNKLFTTKEGISIEIRQPTVGQRSRMLAAGGMSTKNQDLDNIGGMQVAAVIECCYHPGSGKKIFEWTDEDVIKSLPTTSWFDEVATIAMEMMSDEPSEAAKALPKKESASTSSTSPKPSGAQSSI